MSDVVWLLACYGLAFFVVNKMPRPGKLLDSMLGDADRAPCMYCVGFWSGTVIWALQWSAAGMPVATATITHWFVWSLASAVSCYVLDAAAQWLEAGGAE